jgi:hypothetical protein
LSTYASWLESLWLESDGAPLVLTPAQSQALWRRVIAESSQGAQLIGQAGVASWAVAAWELLHRWRIDPEAERAAGTELDYEALLGWCHRFRSVLRDQGWIDSAELEGLLAVRPSDERANRRCRPRGSLSGGRRYSPAGRRTNDRTLSAACDWPLPALRLADSTAELREAVAGPSGGSSKRGTHGSPSW